MRTTKRLVAGTVAVIGFLLVACVPPKPPLPPGVFTDGTYQVNKDIAPGLYMTEPDGQTEYVARLDGGRNILSNDFADRIIVQVQPTDTFVEVSGGQLKPWAVRYPAPNVPLDGKWLVGSEWGAGTYQITPGSSGFTYWARLADVNGETIIDNDFTTGPTYMPVDPTDVAVVVQGVWAA